MRMQHYFVIARAVCCRAARRCFLVAMLVVHIGKVRMGVGQLFVTVKVRMTHARCDGPIVMMLVMFIMLMLVVMLHRIMHMAMFVTFAEMQPDTESH